MTPRLQALVLAVALLLEGAALAKKPKPSCPPGRFLLPAGTRVLTGGTAPTIDAVIVDAGGTIHIASGCGAVRAKLAQTKGSLKLTAKFPAGACAGITRKAKLVAKADAACTSLTATFRAKEVKTSFTARRSVCGDGVVDTDGGETCDLPATPPVVFDFVEDLQGWMEGIGQAGRLNSVRHLDRDDGVVKLDGVDDIDDAEPNAWIFRTVTLPASATTLELQVSAHDRDGANALYRVRLEDQGVFHTLIDWTEKSGIEGDLTFSTVTAPLVDYAGHIVTLYLEQDGNAPGANEQIYFGEVRIQ